ncbi:hypothetical protein V2S85_20830, partial [Novosphingobium resinovorum]|nr:hypothetical protein [Novosphingobium resinovorum]
MPTFTKPIPSDTLDTWLLSWEPKKSLVNEGVIVDADCGWAIQGEANILRRFWADILSSTVRAIRWMISIGFETLIDDSLAKITNVTQLKDLLNKRVLSLVNDFEGGKWRHSQFQNYLWDNIAQTALSERERLALVNQSHSTLVAAARNLRLTDSNCSRGQQLGSDQATTNLPSTSSRIATRADLPLRRAVPVTER